MFPIFWNLWANPRCLAARLSSWTCNMTAALRQQLLPPTVALFYSLFCGVIPSLSHSRRLLPLQPTLSPANHWLKLGLLIFRLHSLKHQLKWFLLNPATLHQPIRPLVSTCCRSLECKALFYFYFPRVWPKCLLKELFNSNGLPFVGTYTYTHT